MTLCMCVCVCVCACVHARATNNQSTCINWVLFQLAHLPRKTSPPANMNKGRKATEERGDGEIFSGISRKNKQTKKTKKKHTFIVFFPRYKGILSSLWNQLENIEKYTEANVCNHDTAQILRWPHDHLGTDASGHVGINLHLKKNYKLCTQCFVDSFFQWMYCCEHFSTSLHFLLTPSFGMAT